MSLLSTESQVRRHDLLRVLFFICVSLLTASCATQPVANIFQRGLASWYGHDFDGLKTANGEVFDPTDLTAAHRTLRFGTIVRVRTVDTSKEVSVRINDRGPYVKGRVIDLSLEAARQLGMLGQGLQEVEISIVR